MRLKKKTANLHVIITALFLCMGGAGCASLDKNKTPYSEFDYRKLPRHQMNRQFADVSDPQEKLKELPPVTAAQYEKMGDGLLHQGEIHQAFVHYEKALELEPEKTIYESKKEVICGSQELKENYLKYFKLLKESIEEQKQENWKKAVELLVKAVEHYDQTGYVYNQIGAIYNNNLGNKERAAQFFKKAIEREPENEVFKRNLKQVLR